MKIQVKSSKLIVMYFISFIVIVFAIMLSIISYLFYLKSNLIVITKCGAIEGISVDRIGKKVNAFYGIPYSEPPIGENRFRRPQKVKPWNGLFTIHL